MDVSNLKLDDIKWNKDQIIFKQTKTRKAQIIPLPRNMWMASSSRRLIQTNITLRLR